MCDKCGYDHELEKFKESMNTYKFIYIVVLLLLLINTFHSYASGKSEIIERLNAIEQKIQALMPAEAAPR